MPRSAKLAVNMSRPCCATTICRRQTSTSTHIRVDLGGFRLRWELHTEFVTYTFTRSLEDDTLNEREPQTAIDVVPQDWLEKLPGEALTSMHVWGLADAMCLAATPSSSMF